MNPAEKYLKQLSELTVSRMGFDLSLEEQGSPNWLRARLGCITASRASDLIARDRSGKGPGKSRKTYLRQLVAEVATGQQKEQGSFKQTEHGHEHEATAREMFAFHVGLPVQQVPFIYGDISMRYGCSPDGIADENSGVEIKAPYDTAVYLDFLLDGEIKPEYIDQIQFSMHCANLPYWHMAMHDPRMRKQSFHAVTLERDEEKMATFKDAIGQMTFDMDSELARLGFRFGDQWPVLPAIAA